jgi:Asp-tRNA(Asn)/Glu-tRNA(Gln) amidotransferase A subunit family amidase
MKEFRRRDLSAFTKVMDKMSAFVYDFNQKWEQLGFTALISPVMPHCAFNRTTADHSSTHLMAQYNYLWSLTGYPAGVVPVTVVEPEEQTFSDNFADKWSEMLNKDAHESTNMPIGLQVVGPSFRDEDVLGIMNVLTLGLGGDAEPVIQPSQIDLESSKRQEELDF